MPVWSPQLTKTNWSKLQAYQNATLSTGCHSMIIPDHLHSETNILPAKDIIEMITNQFVLERHQGKKKASVKKML